MGALYLERPAGVSIATDDTDSPSNVGTRSGMALLDGPLSRPPTYDKRQDKARKKRESCHCVAWHGTYSGLEAGVRVLFGPPSISPP